jgi:hypothetical protein
VLGATWPLRYADYDEDDIAYRAAWREVRELDWEPAYRDFLKVRADSPYNDLAVHGIYEFRRGLDTIRGYPRFIENFHNTAEAVQAMLRIRELAFARAREADDPLTYDAFVTTFPEAKQVQRAIELAFEAERRAVKEEVEGGTFDLKARFFADAHRERVARRLYNEARVAEKEARSW